MATRADLLALGQAVRRARERRGVTQMQLAEEVKRDESTITRLEYGRNAPRVDLLWDVAAALGVPLSQLIAEAELDPDSRD